MDLYLSYLIFLLLQRDTRDRILEIYKLNNAKQSNKFLAILSSKKKCFKLPEKKAKQTEDIKWSFNRGQLPVDV